MPVPQRSKWECKLESCYALERFSRVLGLRYLSILFQHHFGGFDYGRNHVSHFQFHLIRAALGNNAFNQILTYTDDNMGHNVTELKFYDLSYKTISG